MKKAFKYTSEIFVGMPDMRERMRKRIKQLLGLEKKTLDDVLRQKPVFYATIGYKRPWLGEERRESLKEFYIGSSEAWLKKLKKRGVVLEDAKVCDILFCFVIAHGPSKRAFAGYLLCVDRALYLATTQQVEGKKNKVTFLNVMGLEDLRDMLVDEFLGGNFSARLVSEQALYFIGA